MLLDTSGLLCVHHRGEMQHGDAQTLFRAAPLRLTHSYVLAEFIALAQVHRLDRAAALAFVSELQDNPLIEVIWVDELLHRAAIELLHRQLDKTYSLCDAIRFLIMHEHGLVEALTTDRHFEQAGFRSTRRESLRMAACCSVVSGRSIVWNS